MNDLWPLGILCPSRFNTFNVACIHQKTVDWSFTLSFTYSNFRLCSIILFSLFFFNWNFLKRPAFSNSFLWRTFFTRSNFEIRLACHYFIIRLITRKKLIFFWYFFNYFYWICLNFFWRTLRSNLSFLLIFLRHLLRCIFHITCLYSRSIRLALLSFSLTLNFK